MEQQDHDGVHAEDAGQHRHREVAEQIIHELDVAAFAAMHLCRQVAHGRQCFDLLVDLAERSEEHTSELQSLMRISYAVFCLQKKTTKVTPSHVTPILV